MMDITGFKKRVEINTARRAELPEEAIEQRQSPHALNKTKEAGDTHGNGALQNTGKSDAKEKVTKEVEEADKIVQGLCKEYMRASKAEAETNKSWWISKETTTKNAKIKEETLIKLTLATKKAQGLHHKLGKIKIGCGQAGLQGEGGQPNAAAAGYDPKEISLNDPEAWVVLEDTDEDWEPVVAGKGKTVTRSLVKDKAARK